MHRRSLVIAAALLAFAGSSAVADDVHLTNGNVLEGRAERVGDDVIVETTVGTVTLPADEVARIVPGKSALEEYEERLAALDDLAPAADEDVDDPAADGAADEAAAKQLAAAHAQLADWCRGQKLNSQARRHWRRTLEFDPDHRTARKRLGYIRHDGQWMTEAGYYESRGYVRDGGEWVHRDEIARREAQREAQRAMRKHRDKINACVAKMSSMKRKTRQAGRVELQEYAETREDLRLAAFATRVAEFYNEEWRRVKVALEKASALTTVRATHSQLKRPIPEIQTSLGALSTPVRIQLPELSIVRVQTTALIPASIELDDE